MSNSQTAGSKLTNSVRRAKTAQSDNKVTDEEKKTTTETATASAEKSAAPVKAPASKPAAKTTARKAPASRPAAKTTTRKAPATKPAAKAEKEPEAIKPMGSNRRVWPD